MRNFYALTLITLCAVLQQNLCMDLQQKLKKDTSSTLLESSPEVFKAYIIESFDIHPELIESDIESDQKQACLLNLPNSSNAQSRFAAMKKTIKKRQESIKTIQQNNDLLKKETSKSFWKCMGWSFGTVLLLLGGGYRIYSQEQVKPKLIGLLPLTLAYITAKHAYYNFMDGITENGKKKSLEKKQTSLTANTKFIETVEKAVQHKIKELK